MRNIYIFIISIFTFLVFNSNVNALTINSTYRDMPPSNSTTSNLLALAQNYDSFHNSDFVVFSDAQWSYYIVWGNDIKLENNRLIGSKIEYLRYYRTSTNSDYQYQYGTDTSFSLTSYYHNTSSIDGYGFVSMTDLQYKNYELIEQFLILITGFMFILVLTNLKRSGT